MPRLLTSLIDILCWRAENQPHNLSYRFLTDGEYDEVCITYEKIDQRARSIGAMLQASTKIGDRALLLFPAGLDFIAAYFGCLYAKVIAIPAYPPHAARLEKSLPIILRIADDAKPSVALTTSLLHSAIVSRNEFRTRFGNMKLFVTDTDELEHWAEKWRQPEIDKNDIAFLQYSSGSTSSPKGVMVTHNNLMHNLGVIEKSMGLTDKSHTVFWLPPYHDMGLIGGILQALYTGYPVTLMSHLMFLQRPVRWLQAITRFHATTSGGPNFAYDLCVRKIRPEQREHLDLSKWEVAFNGAEPIHHKTLDQFADYFSPCGFSRRAFFPCYGLAEATLMVVGGPKARLPVMKNLVKSGLAENKAIITKESGKDTQTVVSSGQNTSGQKIKIVDVETRKECLSNEIGEIWVSGPSISSGYWNKPLETISVFEAGLIETEEGPFLRTGDLGFFHDEELYITGRLKDLIIIDGRNHYPHDIERTVEVAHQAILPGGCAVFSVDNSGSECVIVMAEIQQKLVADSAEVVKVIRASVAEHHDISIYDVKLTLAGSIPRTTSGKIRHFLCKKNYLAGTLNEVTSV
jgi:acyl-CoA synthetase (AMP-forming)/AMP-acid ligase II